MKRNYLLLILLLFVGSVFLSGCTALFKEPTVTVEAIDIVTLNATDFCLDVTLNIYNPNPFGVTFDKLTANVSYLKGDEWELLSHVEKDGIDIKSGDNSVILQVSLKNSDLIMAGFQFILAKEIIIRIEGVAEPSFFGLSPKIPFNQTRTIPLSGII